MSPIMAQPLALQRLGDTPAAQDSNLKPPGTAAPRGSFPNTGACEVGAPSPATEADMRGCGVTTGSHDARVT